MDLPYIQISENILTYLKCTGDPTLRSVPAAADSTQAHACYTTLVYKIEDRAPADTDQLSYFRDCTVFRQFKAVASAEALYRVINKELLRFLWRALHVFFIRKCKFGFSLKSSLANP